MNREQAAAETQDALSALLKDALGHLSEAVYLWHHPLADVVRREAARRGTELRPSEVARQLRQRLVSTIDQLRPPSYKPQTGMVGRGVTDSSAARLYRLLHLRYVQSLNPLETRRQLGLSKSHYYREHERALAVLVAVLHDQWNGALTAAAAAARDSTRMPGTRRRGDARRRLPRGGAAPPAVDLDGPLLAGSRPPERGGPAPATPSTLAPPTPHAPHAPHAPLATPAAQPARLTRFIGRRGELARLTELLVSGWGHQRGPEHRRNRLITLVGPAGTGKTRLALEVVSHLVRSAGPPIRFIDLAGVREAADVLPIVAQGLGLQEGDQGPIAAALKDRLRERHELLVLDNFEQVLPAAPLLTDLLAACPELQLLVTSRAALRVDGEVELPVMPFATPPAEPVREVGRLLEYESVQLFVDRAQAIDPGFQLDDGNAAQVAELCTRLDGLPLAIELAAARLRTLPLPLMVERMQQPLPLLVGGARDLPLRHRTLRAAIDWSYALLTTDEQTLFRRLAVFSGGCTLQAAEVICGPADRRDRPSTGGPAAQGEAPVLHGLEALVSHSLMHQDKRTDGDARFLMLGTIREYALERLTQDPAHADLVRRHAIYYLELAGRSEGGLRGPRQLPWLNRMELEHDNIQAALGWAARSGEAGAGLPAAAALWRFWYVRGHLTVGRRWLEALLSATAGGPDTAVRAKALNAAGYLAWAEGDNAPARALHIQAMATARTVGDRGQTAAALVGLGNVARSQGAATVARELYQDASAVLAEAGDASAWDLAHTQYALGLALSDEGLYPEARTRFEDVLRVYRMLGDRWGEANALAMLGSVLCQIGDETEAHALCERSLALAQEVGNQRGMAAALRYLGRIAQKRGDAAAARVGYEESLTHAREVGDRRGIAESLVCLAEVTRVEHASAAASALYRQGLERCRSLGDHRLIAACLLGLALLEVEAGDLVRAVRLLGAVDASTDAIGARLWPADDAARQRAIRAARAALSAEAFVAAWQDGRTSQLQDMLDEMLSAGGATPAAYDARYETMSVGGGGANARRDRRSTGAPEPVARQRLLS